MVVEKDDWNPTCNRFVAFLDIMGFKNLVQNSNHNTIYKILDPFSNEIMLFNVLGKTLYNNQSLVNVRPVLFSDSILIVSKNDNSKSANHIMASATFILYSALSKKIPIKGAIAYGKQTAFFSKSMFFGKPLIDAFELQNELDLYGIVLHDSAEKRLNDLNEINVQKKVGHIVWYSTPMKSGNINHYLVNWAKPELVKTMKETKDPIELVQNLYNNVSGKPRKYVDNTLDFLKWIKEKKANKKHANQKHA
jgi:hypothetical protein